jgi:Mce-associated membrane protein
MDETPSPVTDGTPPAKAGEAPSAKAARAGRRGWLSDPLFATALVLVVVAAVFAGWAGSSWYSAANAGPSASAQLRDRVLQAGEQAVLNFNTLDYRHVSAGLRLWEESSTGALHAQITSGATTFARQIAAAATVTTARILDGALTSLNVQNGTADLIVAIEITVTPAKGTADVKQSRLEGVLTRTSSGWKLSSLSQVPVQPAAGSKG